MSTLLAMLVKRSSSATQNTANETAIHSGDIRCGEEAQAHGERCAPAAESAEDDTRLN